MIYCTKCNPNVCLGTNRTAMLSHELEEHLFKDLGKLIDKLPD